MPDLPLDHPGYRKVGRFMREYVELYHTDLQPFASYTLDEIFTHVENIPYEMDAERLPDDEEAIYRPARFAELRGLDCKKKSIFIACWAKLNKLPYRFVAVDDTGAGISHVFAQVEVSRGEWLSMDCTIKGLFKPGAPMPNVVYAEVI